MTTSRIQQAIEGVTQFFSEHPEKGRVTDKSAVAIIQDGLMCKAEGPNGAVLVSDMPKSVGGGGAAPTPGWFLRAAARELRRDSHCHACCTTRRAPHQAGGQRRQHLGRSRNVRARGQHSPGTPKHANPGCHCCRWILARAAWADRRMGRSSLAGRRCDPQSHSVEHGDPDRLSPARRSAPIRRSSLQASPPSCHPRAASSTAAAASRTPARSSRRSPADPGRAPRR